MMWDDRGRSDPAHMEPQRISGALFTDPGVFRDELDRIWNRTWVYVGHESEIRGTGDFVTRQIGLTPVILVRTGDGLRLLVNRCRHRGTAVCETSSGTASIFRCAYHGWSYSCSGSLLGVTYPQSYGPDFDKADFGLTAVPRLESHAGFVFGSTAPVGDDLRSHLGAAADRLHELAESSPPGEIDLRGVLRSRMFANWKLPLTTGPPEDDKRPVIAVFPNLVVGHDAVRMMTPRSAAETFVHQFPRPTREVAGQDVTGATEWGATNSFERLQRTFDASPFLELTPTSGADGQAFWSLYRELMSEPERSSL